MKQRKNITHILHESLRRLSVGFVMFAFISGSANIGGTNSYFSDAGTVTGVSFDAGYWIPELKMSVNPENPDGKNGFYVKSPCVELTATATDLDNTKIFYRLNDSENYMEYPNSCVMIPDGNWKFEAYAEFDENSEWRSATVSKTIKVDAVAPAVEITAPDKNAKVSGKVEIKGTVTDENPDHYWLVIEDKDGHQVDGPGTVDYAHNLDGKLFTWDTTQVSDGEYRIKLEARDQAGNKDPNENPVTEDLNKSGDSVDWVWVKVKNNPQPGDVVINEIMWMGSNKLLSHKSTDEWIELRNTTDNDIDISGWQLTNAAASSGSLTVPAGKIIPAKGFFVIANYDKQSSRIDVDPDWVTNSISLNNDYSANGQIKLLDKDENKIDETPEATKKAWPAGQSGLFIHGGILQMSMERKDSPKDGADKDNWYTCNSIGMNHDDFKKMTDYWDDGAKLFNCGTPGHENLSQNDLSSESEEAGTIDSIQPANSVVVPEDLSTVSAPTDDATASSEEPDDNAGTDNSNTENNDSTDNSSPQQ